MKNKKTILLACLTVLLSLAFENLNAQNKYANQRSNERKIKKVAYNYLDAMGNYRIKEAYPYATKETQTSTLQVIERDILPKTDPNYLKKETPAKITITSARMTSDTTATVLFHKSTPSSEKNNTVDLVKRNGTWYVHVMMQTPGYLKGNGRIEMNPDEKAKNIKKK